MIEVADKVDEWVAAHARLAGGLPGAGLAWLRGLRAAGIARFEELGFPTENDEEWRQTSVAPIAGLSYRTVLAEEALRARVPQADRFFYPGAEALRLVFVDGHFAPALSQLEGVPAGVRAGSVARLLAEDPKRIEAHVGRYADSASHAFVALNNAFFQDGPYVEVGKGVQLEKPIHVVYLATADAGPTVNHPRGLLLAGEGAKAVFVESYGGTGKAISFTNAVTEAVVGAGSEVQHVMIELEAPAAFHVATHQMRLEQGSHVTTHSVSLGGALVRNDLNLVLDGEGIWLQMFGLFHVDGTRHIDNHTSIEHPVPRSDSRELYKGILDGKGKAVFNGKIIVRKDAQQTNAYQENRNLLLSDEAIIDTKPQLEIHANDVKCKHGANIGCISEDQMHYLRTRGVPREEARRILIHAFAAEMVQQLPVRAVRTRLAGMVYGLFGGDPKDAVLWEE